jgi:hypothetical protein
MDIYIRGRMNSPQRCQVCGIPLEAEIYFVDKKGKQTILRLCSGCNYRLYEQLHEFQMKKLSDRG